MNVNKIFIKMGMAIVSIAPLAACSDMLETDSNRVAYENEHKLDNANDSIYSVMGVLAKIQKIADRTILMGELRGDLMTVNSEYANTDLQAIEAFNADNSNRYAVKRDFYDVINNCNYIIARMDTSITEGQTKVMVPEYAQVKTLRAWTYLQMGLIFGQANYFDEPLLAVDAEPAGQILTLDELVDKLISDIEPFAAARPLDYGTVDGWYSAEFFMPTCMLLGDLYLYQNNYERAAENYYQLIYNRSINVSRSYANSWSTPTRTALNDGHLAAYRNEVITRVAFDAQLRSNHSELRNLTYNEEPSLMPVNAFVDEMNQRTHFHTDGTGGISRYFNGDLRGEAVFSNGTVRADAFGTVRVNRSSPERTLITKFYNNLSGSQTDELINRPLTSLALYRPSMVYLRYAEAINRLGKPSMAFAVLKYGLSRNVVSDTLRVDSNEVKHLPAYMNFNDDRFSGNIGTAARGCGLGITYDFTRYAIPADADSVDYVERAILQEMAAETCFEGNRFFDLLCISRHRNDHPRFMAEKVAAKYADPSAMLSRLMTPSAWFVK